LYLFSIEKARDMTAIATEIPDIINGALSAILAHRVGVSGFVGMANLH
jgi:hypothetical protein